MSDTYRFSSVCVRACVCMSARVCRERRGGEEQQRGKKKKKDEAVRLTRGNKSMQKFLQRKKQ